jgi:hypothetical protein
MKNKARFISIMVVLLVVFLVAVYVQKFVP